MFKNLYTQYKQDKLDGLKKSKHLLSVNDLIHATKFIAALPQESFIDALESARSSNSSIISADGDAILANDLKALILIVNKFSVGFYLNVKSQAEHPTFSTAVPYVLYAHKLHNSTSYESWRGLQRLPDLVNPYLKPLVLFDGEVPSYGAEELLELRLKAIVRAGSVQNATAWTLVRTGDADFDALPQCIRRMLLQSWMHNVQNRNKYMINDPNNWDNMPPVIDAGYDQSGQLVDELAGW